ncbi:MAG: DUF87 domain-containing protein [Thermoproteota archaeon]
MASLEFGRTVYERIEVTRLRGRVERTQGHPRVFKILGSKIVLGKDVFSVSERLILETRLRSVDHEDALSGIRMLRGLSATGFEGMFTVSYEPFNYEVRFSSASKSLKGLCKMFSRIRASIAAGFPNAELETLNASPQVALWPLGGLPFSKYNNALILFRGWKISAASFLSMRLEDALNLPEDGLENALRSSAESGCSLRFCTPVKSCRGVLHALSLWVRKKGISSQYSRAYRRLRENGLYNSRGELVGYDLKKSAELERLRLEYEMLNDEAGCWMCSPMIVVIGPSAKSPKQAYLEQRNHVEAVKAAFSSAYGIKLEEVGWLGLGGAARSILARRIVESKKVHLTDGELSSLVNIPDPITPSISYMPKRDVDFGAFDPVDLEREGIPIGYYESMGKRLEVRIGIEDLPLHLAIFGVPGSGKSTLTKALLRRYRELGGFAMVFDRHGEYVDEFDDALVLNMDNARMNLLEHHGDRRAMPRS